MWIRWRFGLNVRRLKPVVFLPTPPRYLALPRSVLWLPNDVFLPLTGHSRPIAPTPRSGLQIPEIPKRRIAAEWSSSPGHFFDFSFCFLAVGLCGLLRCTLPHSSTRSHTL